MSRSSAELDAGMAPDVDKDFMKQTLAYVTHDGDPTNHVVPDFIGQECLDTTNSAWYKAHGTTDADWKKLTP